MLEKLFKSFNEDKENDNQTQELIKASNCGDIAWHTNDIPKDEGKYLVFCNANGIYTKAVAKAHFVWVDGRGGLGQVLEWDIDHFLTQDPIKNDKNVKVLAWANLQITAEDKLKHIKNVVDKITRLKDLKNEAGIMLSWIYHLDDSVSGDHMPNIFLIATELGVIRKLTKITKTFESLKTSSTFDSINVDDLCKDFDSAVDSMRDIFDYFNETTNMHKDFDYAWKDAKSYIRA